MIYPLFAFILFILSVAAHVLFCRRTQKPGLHAKAFIIIALAFLCVYALVISMPFWMAGVDPHPIAGFSFRITAGIIFILLIPIYLCFYVLTQLMSPSKKILLTISRTKQSTYDQIVASIQEEDFIMTRLKDLCISGCVKQIDGRYVLTSEGRKIAGILDMMQRVLGRKMGG